MIDFNNNANHVRFGVKAMNIFINFILSRSKDTDGVRSKVMH